MVETISTITMGNILTIIAVVLGAAASIFINIIVVTSKTAKFVTMTEMKFQAGEKKFTEHDKDLFNLQNRCITCPQKIKVEEHEREKNRMNTEQVKLRAELPVKLENIEKSIADVKKDIGDLREDLALSKKG